MDSPVDYAVMERVAWLTINRPQTRNALSQDVRAQLWDGFRRFNRDESADVMVLTGAGTKAFCAGGDLKEMAGTGLRVPPPDFLPLPGRNIDVVKPTIAAVNGVAFAGGFALAQYCDLCIAADTAQFAISEVRVGRGAPWATPLPWLIPPRIAMELLVTGDPLSADRAFTLGLVNRVVPPDELATAAQQMARRIIANAPLSVRAGKRTVYLAARSMLGTLQDEADQIWEPVYNSADAQEGPAAFRDKRTPRWQGR